MSEDGSGSSSQDDVEDVEDDDAEAGAGAGAGSGTSAGAAAGSTEDDGDVGTAPPVPAKYAEMVRASQQSLRQYYKVRVALCLPSSVSTLVSTGTRA